MTYDGVEERGERAAEGGCAAAADGLALDGVPLPAVLLADDPALRPACFRVSPVEASFFVARPPADVVRLCQALAPGAEPKRRRMVDHYYDLPGGTLFRSGVSARLREYLLNTRPVVFEVIAVSWRHAAPAGPLGARATRVLVQSFARNDAAGLAAMRARYARAGLVETARVEKTRTGFEVLPQMYESAGRGSVPGADTRPVDEDLRTLRSTDLGLKLLVDEMHGEAFPESTVLEVEYDARHEARAVELVARIRAALGPALRAKARNKIAYLQAEERPPQASPPAEEGVR